MGKHRLEQRVFQQGGPNNHGRFHASKPCQLGNGLLWEHGCVGKGMLPCCARMRQSWKCLSLANVLLILLAKHTETSCYHCCGTPLHQKIWLWEFIYKPEQTATLLYYAKLRQNSTSAVKSTPNIMEGPLLAAKAEAS